MRRLLVTFALASSLLWSGTALAGGDGALDAFKAKHTAVTNLVDGGAAESEVQQKTDALLDYEFIVGKALDGTPGCERQCDALRGLLIELIRTRYLRQIEKKATVVYKGEETKADGTHVKTEQTTGPKVTEVVYVLHDNGGKWKVRDILTEGVSLARTYKTEVSEGFDQGGIDAVVARLDAKVKADRK